MFILKIEHKTQNYAGWKKAFDSDPINRKKSGVTHYKIFRPVDDLHYVIIELDFNNLQDAENTLGKLQKLWEKVEGTVIMNPKSRIIEILEATEV